MAWIFECDRCQNVFVGDIKAGECSCTAAHRAAERKMKHDIAWWLRFAKKQPDLASAVEKGHWQFDRLCRVCLGDGTCGTTTCQGCNGTGVVENNATVKSEPEVQAEPEAPSPDEGVDLCEICNKVPGVRYTETATAPGDQWVCNPCNKKWLNDRG